MSTDVVAEVVVRPIRDSDVEALGRVHATCWHETYDHLISAAAFEHLSPRRMAELWNHYAERGEEYQQFAALVDGEIVGFVGSGPARDENPPRDRELYFIYLLDAYHGTGIGQKLFDAAVGDDAGLPVGRLGQPARAPVLRAQRLRPRRRRPARAVPRRGDPRGPVRPLTTAVASAQARRATVIR